MAKHNQTGKWGEQLAVDTLVKAGYAITERNWRLPPYEIDIIAQHGRRIIFCEVKTRTDPDDDPLAAVTPRKIKMICRAANVYVRAYGITLEPQFDIIAITGTPECHRIEHIADAFLPPLTTIN